MKAQYFSLPAIIMTLKRGYLEIQGIDYLTS